MFGFNSILAVVFFVISIRYYLRCKKTLGCQGIKSLFLVDLRAFKTLLNNIFIMLFFIFRVGFELLIRNGITEHLILITAVVGLVMILGSTVFLKALKKWCFDSQINCNTFVLAIMNRVASLILVLISYLMLVHQLTS